MSKGYDLANVPKHVERYAKKLSPADRQKLSRTISGLLPNPRDLPSGERTLKGKISHLHARFECKYRVRLDNLRLVYEVVEDTRVVRLLALGPRGQIYKGR